MFVSRAEAEARLESAHNLTRQAIPAPRPVVEKVIEKPKKIKETPSVDDQIEKRALTVQTPPEPFPEDPELDLSEAELSELTGGRGDDPFHIPSLSKLDDLITPRVLGGGYRLNRPIQKCIAETATVLGPEITGNLFLLSNYQADAYKHGETSQGQGKNAIPEIQSHLARIRAHIALSASVRLKRIIRRLDAPMIDSITDPKDLVSVGKDVAHILEKVTDQKDKKDDGGVNFHIYRPEVRQTNQFNVVKVNSST